MSIAEVVLTVLWVLLASACGWLGFHLAMQNGRLLLRIESLEALLFAKPGSVGLPAGSTLPDFTLPLLTGGTMTLSKWRGRKLALIFTRPGCHQSAQMLPQLRGALPIAVSGGLIPLIISTGDMAANRRFFASHPIDCPVLCDEDSTIAGSSGVVATPMTFVVDEQGTTVGNAVVGAAAGLELLLSDTVSGEHAAADSPRPSSSLARSKIVRDGLKAGTPAPEFRLPTIEDGHEISLGELRGRPLLLVFSDPKCEPCKALAPRLVEIHRNSPDLQLLMISRGDRELNRKKAIESGLNFPVALQAHWEVSRAYGTFATPSAYLVDEHGVLTSDLVTGRDKILGLVRQRQTGGGLAGPKQEARAAVNT